MICIGGSVTVIPIPLTLFMYQAKVYKERKRTKTWHRKGYVRRVEPDRTVLSHFRSKQSYIEWRRLTTSQCEASFFTLAFKTGKWVLTRNLA